MSKRDKLGSSASFAQARPVSARRAAIGAATGVPTVGVPTPTELPLRVLAHNPHNPRVELTEIEETAASLAVKGQIQPVAVVRRAAFLAAHPGQEDKLGDADYVVIDGNRRLAAAHVSGLTKLRVDVNDELAASATDLLESALIANIHRVDVPPLDQAKAIQELVEVHGSQGKVAKHLGKTPAWVSQRLALLELTPDLQKKVEKGELKVEPARRIGRLPKEQQAAAAADTINAVKTPRQRAPRQAADGEPASRTVNAVNAVNASGPETTTEATPSGGVNAVDTPPVTVDREVRVVLSSPSPEEIVDALTAQLSREELTTVVEVLSARLRGEQQHSAGRNAATV